MAKEKLKLPKLKQWRITTPKSIPHKNKKKYTRKIKHKKKIEEKKMAGEVTYRDVEETIKDIERGLAVVTALMKRKNYSPDELRKINQSLGGSATLVNKAIAFGRKMGESSSTDILDKIDNRIDEIFE